MSVLYCVAVAHKNDAIVVAVSTTGSSYLFDTNGCILDDLDLTAEYRNLFGSRSYSESLEEAMVEALLSYGDPPSNIGTINAIICETSVSGSMVYQNGKLVCDTYDLWGGVNTDGHGCIDGTNMSSCQISTVLTGKRDDGVNVTITCDSMGHINEYRTETQVIHGKDELTQYCQKLEKSIRSAIVF